MALYWISFLYINVNKQYNIFLLFSVLKVLLKSIDWIKLLIKFIKLYLIKGEIITEYIATIIIIK